MATNRVNAILLIRNGPAANWTTRNPTLQCGEYGFESDEGGLKIGDGIHDWNHLPYINKFDATYFKTDSETGEVTFSDSFLDTIRILEAAAGQAIDHLTITDQPVNPTDVPNKQYVDDAIANAHHLRRAIVITLPAPELADADTLYMVPSSNGNYYEEYMIINGVWDKVGETGDGGSGGGGGQASIEVATTARIGGVRADDPSIQGHENTEYLGVTAEGYMYLNKVSTTKLYVPTGDILVLNGGSA